MNKAQLIEQVAAKAGWTKKDTAKLVNLVLDEIIDCFHKGESVKISGFGNFVVKQKAERIGKNPINKEEITVPACTKVSFKTSDILKEELKK
jgi:integration host factor subunit alpha